VISIGLAVLHAGSRDGESHKGLLRYIERSVS